jgi:hypothetical protein
MTEEEKQALRNSFAGKSVSQMTPDERKVFDEDFQYGFGNKPASKPSVSQNLPLVRSKSTTLAVLKLKQLIQRK